ncbi:MAG: lysylphosphatidylglycerol synthase transmembrane domain-containing protein [Bacteroidia bacterium]
MKYFLLFAIGILLLWLTFRHENLHDVFVKIEHANFFYVAIAFVFGFVAFVLRSHRWNMLLKPMGFNPKLSNTCYALGIGYFANLAIPRIGEITRCGVLSKSENVPFEKLIGTVIIERVIDLIMLAFSMFVVAILEFDLLKNFLFDKIISPMKEKTDTNSSSHFSMWLIVIFLILIAGAVFVFRSQKAKSIKFKIRKLFLGVVDGLKTIFKMKNPGWFVFHTFFIWILYFLATYISFFSLESTSGLGVKEGIFVLVAGGLGMSAPVQGGIGAYHYIVSQSLMLFNVSSTDGIVYATLVHTNQTLLVVIIGIISLFLVFRVNKAKNNNKNAQQSS